MARMKIAIIDMDNLKNPFWAAGQARATYEVAKRLAKKHTITVYSAKYPGYKNYRENGVSYKHIGITSKYPRIINAIFIPTIPFVVKNIKADVIIENFNAPTSVSFAPLFTRTPIIALPTMFNAIEFTKKYHIPFHLIESLGIKFYKYMLPYSDVDSTKAKKLNPQIVYKIVPQGVGKEFFAIKKQKAKHILFLGRFDIEQKGIDLLLKAYARTNISLPLVIAGHGPDEKKIKELVTKLKLTKRVIFHGKAYGKEKLELMAKAAFVAFPSKHDELSLWALEALAAGLPLVCFNLPESKWMDKNAVLKAKPFNINDYALLLQKGTDAKLNKQMSITARTFAKQFTWEKVAAEFERFIKLVLKKESGLYGKN